jgi:hypothetical protein
MDKLEYTTFRSSRHHPQGTISPRPARARIGGVSMDWATYAICPGCDSKYRAPFGDVVHLHFAACPTCGERKSNQRVGGWQVRTMRFVNPFKLFKRSTWKLPSYWETHGNPPTTTTETAALRAKIEALLGEKRANAFSTKPLKEIAFAEFDIMERLAKLAPAMLNTLDATEARLRVATEALIKIAETCSPFSGCDLADGSAQRAGSTSRKALTALGANQ